MNARVTRQTGRDRLAGGALQAFRDALWSAICACIISYCVVSFIAGQAGLIAYKDLRETTALMRQRSAELQEENTRLGELKSQLQNDADRIAIEARDIGYVRENEKMVLLKTPSQGQKDDLHSVSETSDTEQELEPVRAGYSSGLPDSMIKILSGLIALMILLVSFVSQLLQEKQVPAEIRDQA